ncbi:MAG: helix-turn-helix domain-containing protein [Chloroflexi bacterium]|nr:helix-turn-helix domain-containing protein [Chloroflexota bacterium]
MIDTRSALLRCELRVLPHQAIRDLENDLGLKPEDIAAALGVDRRTVERWRDKGDIPQERARQDLARLHALRDRLLESFTPEGARSWVHNSSGFFRGLKPVQIIRGGQVDGVASAFAALEALEDGAYL